MNPRHIYVHVPFCVRRCGYCDFAVTALREPPVQAWLESVAAELGMRAAAGEWDGSLELDTIYVGGGTPSLLGTGAMAGLRDVLRRFATWTDAAEWTAEANPESFDRPLAEDWVAAGINRVSLGAQTFHEPALRWMGRLHGADGPGRAVRSARDAGLRNISVDLIFGLPARLGRDWEADLRRTLELEPEHISLYGLTAESGTPLGRWVEEGRERLADEDTYAVDYVLASDLLTAAGYRHYEVSNFAKPGCESRHNRAYWDHRPYVGLGPGAHSFLPPVRSWNVREWAEYRSRLEQGERVEASREVLASDAVELERVWLGLRSDDGLASGALNGAQRETVERWVSAGLASAGQAGGGAPGRVRLTRDGWLLLDRLAVELESQRGSG